MYTAVIALRNLMDRLGTPVVFVLFVYFMNTINHDGLLV